MGSLNGSDLGHTLIGVDIGQKRDPTAICVAVTERRKVAGRTEVHFLVRHLERLSLGTPYPDVARRVGEVSDGARRRTRQSPMLYLDATGVGKPVVDILREGVPAVRAIVAVYFTHGDRRTVSPCFHPPSFDERSSDNGPEHAPRQYLGPTAASKEPQVSLGKAFLVSRLQALLQTGRLHLPRSREAEALRQELLDYEIRVDADANDRYGAFRVGTHDDLVTALGLAVQADEPVGVLRSGGSSRRASTRPGRSTSRTGTVGPRRRATDAGM